MFHFKHLHEGPDTWKETIVQCQNSEAKPNLGSSMKLAHCQLHCRRFLNPHHRPSETWIDSAIGGEDAHRLPTSVSTEISNVPSLASIPASSVTVTRSPCPARTRYWTPSGRSSKRKCASSGTFSALSSMVADLPRSNLSVRTSVSSSAEKG